MPRAPVAPRFTAGSATWTNVPCGASTSSPSTVNVARAAQHDVQLLVRRCSVSSCSPMIRWPSSVAVQALIPNDGMPSVERIVCQCACPGIGAVARSSSVHDRVAVGHVASRSRSRTTGSISSSPVDPLLEVLDSCPRREGVVARPGRGARRAPRGARRRRRASRRAASGRTARRAAGGSAGARRAGRRGRRRGGRRACPRGRRSRRRARRRGAPPTAARGCRRRRPPRRRGSRAGARRAARPPSPRRSRRGRRPSRPRRGCCPAPRSPSPVRPPAQAWQSVAGERRGAPLGRRRRRAAGAPARRRPR